MRINTPIITSLLDDDLYKFTMGQVVFHNFPRAKARYEFINRGKTQFPTGFAQALKQQLFELSWIRLSTREKEWLNTQPVLTPTYVDFLNGYQYDLDELKITQEGGDLKIVVEGYWYRTILWEVKLMAIISELYFNMTGTALAADWADRIETKAKALSEAGCSWSDFGTRRRRAKMVQAKVVEVMKRFKGFLGTSNVHLAMLSGVTPIGTSAHEAVMAMEAFVGAIKANDEWCRLWRDYYGASLSIALTDTFTTEVFLRTFTRGDAFRWDGLRQDSGSPDDWAAKVIAHYNSLGIDTKKKKFVFSDDLNVPKAVGLNERYRDIAIPIFGIGTNLTNDTFNDEQKALGIKPLNMVIKLKAMDFGNGWKGVVKLSDSPGKYTGDPADIERIKKTLGI